MERLQFLDLKGLDVDEVHKINSCLFSSSLEYQLPWSVKRKYSTKKYCRKLNPTTDFNGTPMEAFGSTPDQLNYPPQMTFIGVPYNHSQPQMVSYIPNHYQHTTIYPNFHHPPPMIGSRDGLHFMYPNQVYNNYTQVPVTYQNHPQNTHYYPAEVHNQRAQEVQLYNEEPNEKPQSYEEHQPTVPHDNIIPNSAPVLNISTDSMPDVKSEIQYESVKEEKSIASNIVPDLKVNNIEKLEVDFIGTIKNKDNSIGDEKSNDDLISIKKVESSPIEVNGIEPKEEAPVNIWAKKPWVSLFKKDVDITNGKLETNVQDSNEKSMENTKVVKYMDPATRRLGEFLMNYRIDGTITNFQPRGLRNKSNYCYVNAILQALLACPPLCNLLKRLSENLTSNDDLKPIPMIQNMCEFINEFNNLTSNLPGPRSRKKNKKQGFFNVDTGSSFEASWFYTMLNGTRSDSFLVEGRQEDAEEFLGLLLNGLNDEMMGIIKLMSQEDKSQCFKNEINQDSDDWKVMGPKNKGNITRKVQFDKTPISDIFGGLLCSKIHKTGDDTTVNIQPFLTLQLNIEKANTITEALEGLTTRNQLEGLTSSKTKQTVEAWQQVMVEQLPVVLILHLKCFDYKMNGCTKIMKTVDFPIDLEIDSKIISGRTNSTTEKQYKLFAVVYHEGKEASKGHYVTDAFHAGYNAWLRFDDSKIKTVTEEIVLKPQGDRVPYLLFYRRSDSV